MTQPERDAMPEDHAEIFLQPRCCIDPAWGRQWSENNVWEDAPGEGHESAARYVRADIAPDQSARIERLEAALRNLDNAFMAHTRWGEDLPSEIIEARAALEE